MPDPNIASLHLTFHADQGRVRFVDETRSGNVRVRGVTVVEGYLEPGEELRVGDSALHLELGEPLTNDGTRSFGTLMGASPEMTCLYPRCERVAASEVPVIIEGETGTGKEVLAEAIHRASARAKNRFVVFDCTAVPPNLAESILFGHERGAFTGAHATRQGVFEQADGGTLFIDELGDLDPSLQPKLLRAIERAEVQRVGGSQWIKVEVRIIAATRRRLEDEIRKGRFRDDLYYRLAVARLEIPPLRARRGDVAFLAAHFWSALGGADRLPEEFVRRLEAHSWPGNVRELRNVISHRLAMGDMADVDKLLLDAEDCAYRRHVDPVVSAVQQNLRFAEAREYVLRDFHRRYLDMVLEQHGGNVSRAAAATGIARRYFYVIHGGGKGRARAARAQAADLTEKDDFSVGTALD